MQIYYESLLNTRPSKVEIVTLTNQKQKLRATHLYSLFLGNNLKSAFELAFPKRANLDDSPIGEVDSTVADDE